MLLNSQDPYLSKTACQQQPANTSLQRNALLAMAFLVETIQAVRTYFLPLLVVLLLTHLARNRYKPVLRDIPGPFLASLSDLWQLVHCYRGESRHEYRLHRKYGSSLLRLGPNKIAVADPEAIRVIYGYKPVFAKVFLPE